MKESSTYEHINPEVVGNRQRVLLSDLSGRGNVLYKLKQHGLEERLDDSARRELLDRIKQLEFKAMSWKPPKAPLNFWCARRCSPVCSPSRWWITRPPPDRPAPPRPSR